VNLTPEPVCTTTHVAPDGWVTITRVTTQVVDLRDRTTPKTQSPRVMFPYVIDTFFNPCPTPEHCECSGIRTAEFDVVECGQRTIVGSATEYRDKPHRTTHVSVTEQWLRWTVLWPKGAPRPEVTA
jgi:hypothetical protein